MVTRQFIRFLLNDRVVEIDDISSRAMLLDYLRLNERLCGTKEGCAEGDCGACTVLVGRLEAGELTYRALNACIAFLGSLDGAHVVTIEHLAGPDGTLHPVQQAMVGEHGSQCGFCTPGIVMALYAFWLNHDGGAATQRDIERALQGNLCRCTGYAPIIRAGLAMGNASDGVQDRLIDTRDDAIKTLTDFQTGERVAIGSEEDRLFIPANLDDLATLYEAHPEATLVAGATDVGLWVNKDLRDVSPVIFIGTLDQLQTIEQGEEGLYLGACVSYTRVMETISAQYPALETLFWRIGGEQVRNAGTIGGNIANGSPIGDTPPPLIALGAKLHLRKGDERRSLPLEAFFIDYGKQDRMKGEFVEGITIPPLAEDVLFNAYKISKRRDEDISALLGAFLVRIVDGMVVDARIAFGGMAATPKRAQAAEQALVGAPWNDETIENAVACFDQDFTPLTDWRASAEYRMLCAKNLLRRFYLENTAAPAQEAAE